MECINYNLSMNNKFDFYKRIALIGEYIPYGKVVTYGQVALLCGKPKNARQVGYALNHNLTGEAFPAHRVVNSQGYLSGAASFSVPGMQKKMLLKEGVQINDEERVNLKKFGWHNTLDEALLLLDQFQTMGI